ncbi:hypothetical protein ACFQMG_10415 [Kitasatospora paranensis]|uniref:Uncharacterized protein n=3 Tax=Kitasatospora paranensis TaxID=258053 RepID=A0ABW2FU99_9ACTN
MPASMADGSGNDHSAVFSPAGAFARVFDHESPMTPRAEDPLRLWPGLVNSVPEAFRPLLTERAFCESDGTLRATVCFWRETSDIGRRSVAVDLRDEDNGDVDHKPLTRAAVALLNPDRRSDDVHGGVARIGYGCG